MFQISPYKKRHHCAVCQKLKLQLHPSAPMDKSISNVVQVAMQGIVVSVQGDIKAKMDMFEAQLGDLKEEILKNQIQLEETVDIFKQCKSEILIELADIKGMLVKSCEGIDIPRSQNVPHEASIRGI